MSQLILEYDSKVSVENSIKSAINNEIKMLEIGMDLSKKALKQFEEKYNMLSERFFDKMEKGELQDTLDFIEWAGECELVFRTQEKLNTFNGLRICA